MAKMKGDHEKEQALDFSKMLAIVWKNWLVMSRDRIRLVMLLLFPIIMITMFGYTAGAIPKYLPAAIVDYDHSNASQMITSELYSNQLFIISHVVSSQDEGKKLIDEGQVDALFIIPQGLQSNIISGQSPTLYAIFDESNPTVSEITQSYAQLFVQQLSLGITLQKITAAEGSVGSAQQDISTAKQTMTIAMNNGAIEGAASSANSNYRAATSTSSQLTSSLSSAIQTMRNPIAYLLTDNPNQIAATGANSFTDANGALYALNSITSQSQMIAQIAAYQGIMGGVSAITADTIKLYYSTNEITAASAANNAAVSAAYSKVSSAGTTLSETTSQLNSASSPSSQLSLTVLEPYGIHASIDFLLPSILALTIFQGASSGLGRAIAGEKKDGSLTRVFMTPTSNTTIIVGTQLFYIVLEIVRAVILFVIAAVMFGVIVRGSLLDMIPIIIIYVMGAVGVGMVLSVLTNSQEQYMALSMLIVMPSMLLSGVFLPIQTMPSLLQAVAKVLPITYAADAFRGIMIKGLGIGALMPDIIFLTVFCLITMSLSVLLFKRELV